MASSIPKMYRKEITDALAAETLKVALFTNTLVYDPVNINHATYTQIAAAFTEVSSSGTGYTTGGYALTGLASSYVGATNVAILTASATAIAAATFTCRYGVVYRDSDKKIRAVVDLGGDKTVTGGTMTITWDATNGIIRIS